VAIVLIRALPPVIGPAAVAGLLLLPVPLYLVMPSPPPDARLAGEGFVAFLTDVLSLFRQRDVRWLLFFFAMPAASFALSNTMSGLGKDFGASEQFVGTVAGVGVAIAGVLGSLVVPPLVRGRLTPQWLYLAIGAGGAVCTLAQLVLPLTPLSFAIAMIGQNGIQAAALSAGNVAILRATGEHNPLAATQFALLSAAMGLPLSYMQALDGQAYDRGGLAACYMTDALVSLGACAILALLLGRRRAPLAAA
jgi:PAT family beta-lactamase induction signal transducer AmpG